MPDFTVDVGGLTALEKNLQRTVENIGEALDRMKEIGPKSIGPDSLDAACADFTADWQGGLEKISEAVDVIKGSVDKAIQGYVELEANLRDTLTQMAEEVRAVGGNQG